MRTTSPNEEISHLDNTENGGDGEEGEDMPGSHLTVSLSPALANTSKLQLEPISYYHSVVQNIFDSHPEIIIKLK